MQTPVAGAQSSKGYHRLAAMMGPYQETGIFRRFGPLNMINLLSLQAELIELNATFRNISAEDDGSSDANEKNFSSSFRALRESEGSPDFDHYQKLLEIRGKLREYSMATLNTVLVVDTRACVLLQTQHSFKQQSFRRCLRPTMWISRRSEAG